MDRFESRVLPAPHQRGRWADLRRLVVRTVADSFDDHVPGLAAEMAFFTVLSLPPLLLAILGSVGFVVGGLPEGDIAALEQEILGVMGTFLAEGTVEDVLAGPVRSLLREGRSDVLSLGVVLTLWSASRATNVLLRTLTIAYDLEDRRSPWRRRLLAMAITLVGILLAVVVIPLLVVGPRLALDLTGLLGLDRGIARLWFLVYWAAVVAVALVALTWLYHVAPGWKTPWSRDFPGAVLALVVWLLAAFGLRVYAARFMGFDEDATFRSLAAPLVLLLWVYATAIALLLGAELNAEIERLWPTGGERRLEPSAGREAEEPPSSE